MQLSKTVRQTLLLLIVVLLTAGPALAYTVVLKDGSKIMAREKYQVRGTKAYITYPNGTTTFIELSEIDVGGTEEANAEDYGTALVVEGGKVTAIRRNTPPPPREPTLRDVISRREFGPSNLPEARRRSPEPEDALNSARMTPAGFVDLQTLRRTPYTEVEIATELQRQFRGQGLDQVRIYRGTATDRLLLEVSTDSESSVFRALVVSASALLNLRETHPEKVGTMEVLMITSENERAGQFVLTPDAASLLMSKQVDVRSFYLENVQF